MVLLIEQLSAFIQDSKERVLRVLTYHNTRVNRLYELRVNPMTNKRHYIQNSFWAVSIPVCMLEQLPASVLVVYMHCMLNVIRLKGGRVTALLIRPTHRRPILQPAWVILMVMGL